MKQTEQIETVRDKFITSMASAPTAVTVVAVNDGAKIWGQTVSAFASVTADPPTLLVCINSRSPILDQLKVGAKFSVNLLARSQIEIANCFAGKSTDALPAYGSHLLDWNFLVGGVPILNNTTSSFACEVDSVVIEGTHGIVIGRVFDAISSPTELYGLAYCKRQYKEIT